MDIFSQDASADERGPLTLQRLADALQRLGAQEGEAELELVALAADEELFRQGDAGDGIYMIIAGELGVRVVDEDGAVTEINRHGPGAIVGEMAMLSGQARTATVYAIDDTNLFKLGQTAYRDLVARTPQTETAVASAFDARWQALQLARLLRPFIGADADLIDRQPWYDDLSLARLANGDVVFRQGDAADGMVFLVNGRLRIVTSTPDDGEQTIGEITPGETVGEFGLLTGEPRSATVFAVRDSTVVTMSRATFDQLARLNPQFMTEITKRIVLRQRALFAQSKPPVPSALSIAVVPASTAVDVTPFAGELAAAMDPYGRMQALDAAQFDGLFGKEGAAQAAATDALDGLIASWLDEFESNHAFVLYAADATLTPWTRRCLGRADRVLVVGRAGDDPTPGEVEQAAAAFEVPVRSELVLLHPPETERPSGTAVWLNQRDLFTHHHVRMGDAAHVARVARRLTGHAVAVVFSGGGALGYAEMGVYRAMVQLGIPIDFIGGTSMGAIMSGAIACGYSYAVMQEQAQTMADIGVMDITLPLASLTASEHVSAVLQDNFGGFNIEDLWIPYFCVSTNFSIAERVIHRRGPLWRAIRASMSVPGVFLPIVEDGNVLVDGGIMDNFPVEEMVQSSESNTVIGVHISPYKERKRQYDYDTSLSGWRILWSRLNPFRKALRTPSLMQTLTLASLVNGIRTSKLQEQMVDVMITPDVGRFSFSDYDKWRPLAEAGYESALAPLEAWKATRPDLSTSTNHPGAK